MRTGLNEPTQSYTFAIRLLLRKCRFRVPIVGLRTFIRATSSVSVALLELARDVFVVAFRVLSFQGNLPWLDSLLLWLFPGL